MRRLLPSLYCSIKLFVIFSSLARAREEELTNSSYHELLDNTAVVIQTPELVHGQLCCSAKYNLSGSYFGQLTSQRKTFTL